MLHPSIHRSIHFPVFLALGSLALAGEAPVVPAGTQLKPVPLAKEALSGTPARIAVDARGGILVAELPGETKPKPAAGPPPWLVEDLATTLPEQRDKLLEKWLKKPSPPTVGEPLRFIRLADPDGDGTFGAAPLTASPLKPAPEGPAVAMLSLGGDTYLIGSPGSHLLPPAKDGKPAAASPLLGGFGLRMATREHGPQGLALGPDGRLYGVTGDQGFHFTAPDGGIHPLPNQGCAFRMEIDGTGFEIFHRGLRNPRGIVFDALGNAFTIDSGIKPGEPARLIYLVEGGDSGWRMEYQALMSWHQALELKDPPPNPWDAELLWETATRGGAAYVVPPIAHLAGDPLAIASHPGTGLLESEAGRLLVCDGNADPSRGGILSLSIVPDGAGMKLADSRPLVAGLTATDACFTWDGRLLVADGPGKRLLTLDAGDRTWQANAATDAAKTAREDFEAMDSGKLAGLLKHADFRIRLLAQISLSRKPDALEKFGAAIASADPNECRHAIWGIGILARCGRGAPLASTDGFAALPDQKLKTGAARLLIKLLKNALPEVRAEALRMLADGPNRLKREDDILHPRQNAKLGPTLTPEELPLAALLVDESPRVRYFAAIAIGNLKATGLYGQVCDFLTANDNRDPYLRHAGAFALQHMITGPLMLTGLENHPSAPVRLGAAIALRGIGTADAAAFINDKDLAVAEESVRAVTDLDLPDSRLVVGFLLDEPVLRAWSPFAWRRIVHNAFREGGAANAARLLKLVGHPAVPAAVQLETLRLCQQWTAPAPVNSLTGRWAPLPPRDAAEIKPALTSELARMLATKDPVREEVVKLAKAHQLTLPAAPAAPQVQPSK